LWGSFQVCIGIYQGLRSRFLRAKRGEIVVNCVVERGEIDGVQEAVSLLQDL
jgi:hypothetical protein